MRNSHQLFPLIIAFTLLIACKKSNVDRSAGMARVTQLSFIYLPSSSQPEPSQVDFSYDGNERVKTILIYLGDSGVAIPSTDTVMYLSFFYNDANKLPYLIFHKKQMYGNTWESHSLSYDASNRVIKDSITNQTSSFVILYTYDGNKTIRHNSLLGSWYNDTMVSQNGNYIQSRQKDRVYYYEFDGQINPLNNLNIAPVFDVISYNGGLWSLWTANNKNNITAEKVYSTDGVLQYTQHQSIYFYDPQGLPQKRIWYSSSNPREVVDTMFYKY